MRFPRLKALSVLTAAVVSALIFGGADTLGEVKPGGEVFIITDTSGVSTEVTNVRITKYEGGQIIPSETFVLMVGDAQVTMQFHKIAGVVNNFTTNEVKVYFSDGSTVTGKYTPTIKVDSIVGNAIIGGQLLPYSLKTDMLKSCFVKGFTPAK